MLSLFLNPCICFAEIRCDNTKRICTSGSYLPGIDKGMLQLINRKPQDSKYRASLVQQASFHRLKTFLFFS